MRVKDRKFEDMEEIMKVDIKKFFGSYGRIKELLNALGHKVEVVKANEGETGKMYKLKYRGKEYIGICSYPKLTIVRGKKYKYYTYYLMEPDALQEYFELFY